jgi:hypothetical protein
MRFRLLSALFLGLGLAACSTDYTQEDIKAEATEDRRNQGMEKFLGGETLVFGGLKKRELENTDLGVNSYLWRASLDTISFMPMASADPFGGVILTDWYSPTENSKERLKVNIFILDKQLRSDGLRVSVFRQERDSSGHWSDRPVDPQAVKDLENTILARARHFRTTTK